MNDRNSNGISKGAQLQCINFKEFGIRELYTKFILGVENENSYLDFIHDVTRGTIHGTMNQTKASNIDFYFERIYIYILVGCTQKSCKRC